MASAFDLTGQVFGNLTVITEAPTVRTKGHTRRYSHCACVCGNKTITRNDALKSGRALSCGTCCRITHGASKTPEYKLWSGIIDRTTNPHSQGYASYGKRGITVCERWLVFERFQEDMLPRPDGMTIERTDNNGPYSPENCKWATWIEQGRNKRNNIWITHNGKTLTAAEWGREIGVDARTLRHRFHSGWAHDRIIDTLTDAYHGCRP